MWLGLRAVALLAVGLALSGCPGPGGPGSGAGPSGQMRTLFGGPNCELKNPSGSGTCDDGSTLIGRADGLSGQDNDASSYSPVSAQADELPTSNDVSEATSGSRTGGCVWKNRSYQPGDKIRSMTDGTILSEDLFINGENFGDLSGQSGPWQGCDCSSSSGKWGCV